MQDIDESFPESVNTASQFRRFIHSATLSPEMMQAWEIQFLEAYFDKPAGKTTSDFKENIGRAECASGADPE